jgi:hypothetical protein
LIDINNARGSEGRHGRRFGTAWRGRGAPPIKVMSSHQKWAMRQRIARSATPATNLQYRVPSRAARALGKEVVDSYCTAEAAKA